MGWSISAESGTISPSTGPIVHCCIFHIYLSKLLYETPDQIIQQCVKWEFNEESVEVLTSRSPRRVNPTCRSGRFRSDPHQISSESDIFHKKPIGSDRVFVGSDRNYFDPTGSDHPSVTWAMSILNKTCIIAGLI